MVQGIGRVISSLSSMKIIFQDKDFIIVDKPVGIPVHAGIGTENPSASSRKASWAEKTLVDFLVEKFPEIKSVGDSSELRPGIVHRLDRETSGVLVVARNQEAFNYLKDLFKKREVEKKYLVLVHGRLKNKEGKIEGEMGRSRRDFRKQSFVRGKIKVRKGRYSLTYYRVLKEWSDYSLLEVFPKTGRMHQIRIHLHSLGYPVVGDLKYTFKKYKKQSYPRMFLHAREISFRDQKGKRRKFISPLPQEMKDFLGRIDDRKE
jgi:23S rRNA pseudouridine1911/1915/1917 synthase